MGNWRVITPISGVITLLTTGIGPILTPCYSLLQKGHKMLTMSLAEAKPAEKYEAHHFRKGEKQKGRNHTWMIIGVIENGKYSGW